MFSKLEFRRGGFSPWGSPAVLDGPVGTRGPKPVCMSVGYPLAGAWRELQLKTSAAGWRGGMPGVYSGIALLKAYLSAGFISAELDFLDSVPS